MFEFGAIDVETQTYVLPTEASKGKNYVCAECDQKVIVRQGMIRKHHYAHYSPTTKCKFYDSAGETELHKHAKLFIKSWLEQKKSIWFAWACRTQFKFGLCNRSDDHTEDTLLYKEGDRVVLEYRDPKGKYIADIAVLNAGNVRYIIEVQHTHKTTTDCRPEPWVEISADEATLDNCDNDVLNLENIRTNEKRGCANCTVKREPWVGKIPILSKKQGAERNWEQDSPCIYCERISYNPEFIEGKFRQVCKICLGTEPEKVRQISNDLFWK